MADSGPLTQILGESDVAKADCRFESKEKK